MNDAYSPYTFEHIPEPAPSWALRAGIPCPEYAPNTSYLFVDGAWTYCVPEGPSQAEINEEARLYLASTDWYVVRFQETGVTIPEDISQARAEARESIKEEPNA